MNPEIHCEVADLYDLVEGRTAGDSEQALIDHLDACDFCRRTLDAISGGQDWASETGEVLRSLSETVDYPLRDAAAIDEPEDRDGGALPQMMLQCLGPTDDPAMLGRLGAYEVAGVIGCGGAGIVFKAREPALNRFVAVKVLSPLLACNGAARKRFAREARAAAAVVHEHIVPIYAVDEYQGLPFLVMQYIPGRSLQQRLQAQGPLGVREILRIGHQAALGLAAAHAQGVVHRDIKPANILMENGVERVLLTDFGLARTVDDASLTCSGVIAGTPEYMSPEQARGEAVDHRSDLFSLGSVLYALCTGHSPFRASTTMGILQRICQDRPRPIHDVNPEIPVAISEYIERLLDKRVNRRPSSAQDVAAWCLDRLADVQAPDPYRPSGRRAVWLRPVSWLAAPVVLAAIGFSLWDRPEPVPTHDSQLPGSTATPDTPPAAGSRSSMHAHAPEDPGWPGTNDQFHEISASVSQLERELQQTTGPGVRRWESEYQALLEALRPLEAENRGSSRSPGSQ